MVDTMEAPAPSRNQLSYSTSTEMKIVVLLDKLLGSSVQVRCVTSSPTRFKDYSYSRMFYHFPTHLHTGSDEASIAFGVAAADACECMSGVLDTSGDLCGELLCCLLVTRPPCEGTAQRVVTWSPEGPLR